MTQSDRLTVFRLNEISVRRGQRIAFYNENDDDDLPASLNFLVKDAADLITGRSVFDE